MQHVVKVHITSARTKTFSMNRWRWRAGQCGNSPRTTSKFGEMTVTSARPGALIYPQSACDEAFGEVRKLMQHPIQVSLVQIRSSLTGRTGDMEVAQAISPHPASPRSIVPAFLLFGIGTLALYPETSRTCSRCFAQCLPRTLLKRYWLPDASHAVRYA